MTELRPLLTVADVATLTGLSEYTIRQAIRDRGIVGALKYRTHCSRGHEMTPENTLTKGGRRCRQCGRERARTHRRTP